ncbi:hypothetical protein C0U44_31235, partial [Klebsiella pneumoniae]
PVMAETSQKTGGRIRVGPLSGMIFQGRHLLMQALQIPKAIINTPIPTSDGGNEPEDGRAN